MRIQRHCLLTLLLAALLSSCSQATKKDPENLRIADLEKESNVFPTVNTITPSHRDSIAKYRDYLSDDENSIFRAEALRHLAALELEGSEIVNEHQLEQKVEASEQSLTRSIEHFTDYLKLYPNKKNNDYVFYQLAKAYELAGETEKSLQTLDEIIKRYPNTWFVDEIQFRRGEILFLFNDYISAEQAYLEVVSNTMSPEYTERSLYKLIWSQFKQEKYMEALENCISLLDRLQAQGKLGDVYITTGIVQSENDFVSDVLRVMTLSLSYKEGVKTIQKLLANKRERYEPLFYRQLSHLYLKTERILDAAEVYLEYAGLYSDTLLAAEFHMLAIKTYADAGLAELLLVTKANFVKNFGVGSRFWNSYDVVSRQSVREELKTSIYDLANYYHAIALKTGRSQDYMATTFWYKEYIRSFPSESSTPMMNFLLAESQYDAGQYDEALNEYIKTAYSYKFHSKSAESGYASILTYKALIARTIKQKKVVKVELKIAALQNAIRFSAQFKNSTYAPAVIASTAETLYEYKNYTGAVEFASKYSYLKNMKDQSYFKTTWLVYAHSLFELQEFESSEQAYSVTRDLMLKGDKLYADVSEKLAASIYMQAKKYHGLANYKLASFHFLRVGQRVPSSKIHATAQYDAATSLILSKKWMQATHVLEGFRETFPKNNKYTQGISEKLVLTYTETGQSEKAAGEALYLSKVSANIAERRAYVWLAAELYQKTGVDKKANMIYIDYVKKFPEPFVQNIEAHQRIIDYYRKNKDATRLKKWLAVTVNAEKSGKNNRTDRTRFIAANAALEMTAPLVADFKQVTLKVPLKKSLRAKKKLMEKALKAYSELMAYEIADITTASTYHVADIYGHFAENLMKSQRPKNLNAEELEQYDILLEEQAYPFEEKSIDIHSANAKRTSTGLYDKWVKRSIEALTVLQPIRYSKTERIERYVAKNY